MKNLLSLTLFILFSSLMVASAAEDKKDWVLDLKTSTLIPNYIGKVKVLRGKVMVGEDEIGKGDKIYPKNIIKTSEKSFVVFELIDDTVLTLGPNTEFTFENWAFRTKTDREGIYSLVKGKMRAEIKVKTKEDDQLKIKSPLVAMGIRGTEVLLNNSEVKGKMVTQVALIEGKVVVLNSATDKKMNMVQNDYIEVTEDRDVPEIEKKLSEEEVKKYNLIMAPSEKLLMDYPISMNDETIPNTNGEVGTGDEAVSNVQSGASQLKISKTKNQADSWRENLKKLNELREKRK